ncbi:MAG: FecR domain-containing protein [Anaerolineae bacterium]|nr:FecR domain-containing protein [Anaerolineae bacterium]
MQRALNDALAESLTCLETGQATIEECLSRHPAHAADLRPLLEIALAASQAPKPVASVAAFATGKQRMLAALAEKKRRETADPGLLQRYAKQIAGQFSLQRRAPALQWVTAVAAVIAILIAGILLLQPWPETQIGQTAFLDQASGSVEFQPAGSEDWQPASTDTSLRAGTRIRTGPHAGVTLVFFDGSTTVLEAETEVSIVQMDVKPDGSGKTIVLRQEVGQTFSHVQPLLDAEARFEIETPTSVTAVRGTKFGLDVEPDGATHLNVTEGVVEMTAQDVTISVSSGQTAEVKPDHAPASIPSDTPLPSTQAKTPQPTGPTATLKPAEKADPTETSEATETPEPTVTPLPTMTPEPTFTPLPTNPPSSTEEPPPTKKPHPTQKPLPTKRPLPTKKP